MKLLHFNVQQMRLWVNIISNFAGLFYVPRIEGHWGHPNLIFWASMLSKMKIWFLWDQRGKRGENERCIVIHFLFLHWRSFIFHLFSSILEQILLFKFQKKVFEKHIFHKGFEQSFHRFIWKFGSFIIFD